MNFLASITPNITDHIETTVFLVAGLGAILLTYATFVEAEHRSDLIRVVGAGGLLVYALYIGNLIFIIAMAGIFAGSLIEFIEIYLGLHKHSKEDLIKYKKMR